MSDQDNRKRCAATVYVRDTYRVSRGRGFTMHHIRSQCSRMAPEGERYCWQHRDEHRRNYRDYVEEGDA